MKRFFLHLSILVVFLLISSEIITRVFNLANMPLKKIKKDGITLYEPYQSGTMVFGNFGDIRAKFNINPQGYNSLSDYNDSFEGFKYAIIGDSFVEGFHENVNKSIGKRAEKILPETQFHEYGRSGWNAHNYLQLCNNIANQYNKIFVICDTSDFMENHPEQHTINTSNIRKLVIKSRLFCYLYYNRKAAAILVPKRLNYIASPSKNHTYEVRILPFQNKFPSNVVWVWRNSKETKLLSDNNIAIKHDLTPYTFGLFDDHWNSNGRQNAAETISSYIKIGN